MFFIYIKQFSLSSHLPSQIISFNIGVIHASFNMDTIQAPRCIQHPEISSLKTLPGNNDPIGGPTIDNVEESISQTSQSTLAEETSLKAWLSVLGAFLFLF